MTMTIQEIVSATFMIQWLVISQFITLYKRAQLFNIDMFAIVWKKPVASTQFQIKLLAKLFFLNFYSSQIKYWISSLELKQYVALSKQLIKSIVRLNL